MKPLTSATAERWRGRSSSNTPASWARPRASEISRWVAIAGLWWGWDQSGWSGLQRDSLACIPRDRPSLRQRKRLPSREQVRHCSRRFDRRHEGDGRNTCELINEGFHFKPRNHFPHRNGDNHPRPTGRGVRNPIDETLSPLGSRDDIPRFRHEPPFAGIYSLSQPKRALRH